MLLCALLLQCGFTRMCLCVCQEIEALDASPIHKLQLIKAIEYLKAETAVIEDTVQMSDYSAYAPAPQPLAPDSQLAMENQRLREGMESIKDENLLLRTENATVADHLHKLSLTSENNAALVQAAAAMASAESSNGLRSLGGSTEHGASSATSNAGAVASTQSSSDSSSAAAAAATRTSRLAPKAAATVTISADFSRFAADLQRRGNAAAAEIAMLRAEVAQPQRHSNR